MRLVPKCQPEKFAKAQMQITISDDMFSSEVFDESVEVDAPDVVNPAEDPKPRFDRHDVIPKVGVAAAIGLIVGLLISRRDR
jgi:hypothetical protein